MPYGPSSSPFELIKNFNQIDDKILLFLDSLKELSFVNNIDNTRWTITQELQNDSVVSLLNTRTAQMTRWKVFHKVIHVENRDILPDGKEGIEKTRITIAFPIEDDVRESTKKTGVVYCYLPTRKRADLSFLIQADFLPTIGRENISEHEWNFLLMKQLGVLAAEAVDKMKDDEQILPSLYEFIPLSEEIADSQIRLLNEQFSEGLKERKIARTSKGWVVPTDCVIPVDNRLRNILSEADLKLLFDREVFYIDTALSKRAEEVLHELGAEYIGAKEVVNVLKMEDVVSKKTKDWFLNLYEYLTTVFDTTKKLFYGPFPWNWDEETKNLFEELLKTKFILTDDEKLVPLKDPDKPDRLLCYPERIDLSEVHQLFTEGEIVFLNRFFQETTITRQKDESAETEAKRERVKEWFDSIGVKKYFKQTHIIREVILPKFRTEKFRQYSDSKLYDFVDYIRRYWSTIESEIANKKISADFIGDIKNSIMVKTFTNHETKRIDGYKNPRETYFSRRYGKLEVMEELFEGINDIQFLSSYYLNREKKERKLKKRIRKKVEYSWKKFFEILGVWSSPRVEKKETWISISGMKEYYWLQKEWSPRGIHEVFGDSFIQDITNLIEYCSKINDSKQSQRRMRLLWYSLEKYWKVYKENYCKITYKWFYCSEQTREYETSSFLEFLRNSTWVPSAQGGFSKPSAMFADSNQNRLLLGDEMNYVSLKAGETFLKDVKVTLVPEINDVLKNLESYKAKNPILKEDIIEKMNAIYIFIRDKTNGVVEPENKTEIIKELSETFDKNELLYLPREDKTWWKPIEVFWKDYSDVFETLRGYVEYQGIDFYNPTLKEFFSLLGTVEKPRVKESLDILQELKEKSNMDVCRRIYPKTYIYLNDLTKQGLSEGTDWNTDVFLTEKGHYLRAPEIFYSDNDEYKDCFESKLEILWLPFSWNNIEAFLKAANFRKLSGNITIVKKFGALKEIEGSDNGQLILRASCAEKYLKKKNFGLFNDMQAKGIFSRIDKLQAFETPEIALDYSIKLDNEENEVISDIKKDAYFSFEENRIYKSSHIELFSTPTAKELSKLFYPAEDYVFPFLDSLFSARNDEELNEKLKFFGVKMTETLVEEPTKKVKIITHKEKEGQEKGPEDEHKTSEKKTETVGETPHVAEATGESRSQDLINPDEFVFETVEEFTPYVKTDGSSTMPKRTIKLRPGRPGDTEKKHKHRERIVRSDAEGTALELAMRFEEEEDRNPEDRHDQKGIGYDIYSKTATGDEIFVEVKHFRGDAGTWELKPHQYKKAEVEKDRYFVYVVSGLKEGSIPTIEIIQNPAKYLIPDPAVQKMFSDWKNGVVKTVKCQKV